MSAVKHTPGPWEIYAGSLDVYGPVQPTERHPNYRRRVSAYPWTDKDDEGRANAALIAAAPDLLAAVQALHDWRGLCDANDMETFERIAEQFHRETGYLRPGKDSVLHSREEREPVWSTWVDLKNAELDAQIMRAIAKAKGGVA